MQIDDESILTPEGQKFRELHLSSAPVVALPPDMADYVFGALSPDHVLTPFTWDVSSFGDSFSLRPFEDFVKHQQFNDCVGNGTATLLELFSSLRGQQLALSPLFSYWNARKMLADALGQPMADVGAAVTLAFHELRHKGICLETYHAYHLGQATEPNPAAFAEALGRLVGLYERCGRNTYNILTGQSVSRDMEADMKVALKCGCPIGFGIPLSWAFYNLMGPLDTHPEQWQPPFIGTPGTPGNHFMAVIGWRTRTDGKVIWEVENSWGPTFADGGFVGMTTAQLSGYSFDVLTPRSLGAMQSTIPWSYYKWTGDCVLGDGTRVSVDKVGAPGQIFRLYRAAFGRLPDKAGLGYQIDAAGTLGLFTVAQNFLNSPEFTATYGLLDDAAYITQLYTNVLHRAPEAGAVPWYVDMLSRAGQPNGMTRAQVLVGFSESPENKANTDADFGHGINFV